MFTASCTINGQAAAYPYRIETNSARAVYTGACVLSSRVQSRLDQQGQLSRKQQLQMSYSGAILRQSFGKSLCRIRAKKQRLSDV